MEGIVFEVKHAPDDGEIFIKGDGAVLSVKEDIGEIERVMNALAKLQPLAVREYIGLKVVLDEKCRSIVMVEPEGMRLEVERIFSHSNL